MNWIVSPDAKWGFFVPNPVNGKSGAQDAWRITIPPWPDAPHGGDTVDRTTFVQEPIRVHTNAKTSIRIAFGYAENGNPANLYCTTRQETCWTSAAATESNPFAFASEAQQRVSCESECTVYIPAIAGRILFYRIERVTGSKTVTDPLEAKVVLGGPQ